MSEITWILDPASGKLVVEGLTAEEASALAGDLLPPPREVNCARPTAAMALPRLNDSVRDRGSSLQVARLYHNSVVDGPGRRSVVQLQGCLARCPQCFSPETHDPAGGVPASVASVVAALRDPQGEPRDGVTVTGGEPFLQPAGLLALLQGLKAHGLHVVVYSGYRLEVLLGWSEPEILAAIRLIDLLIDGPFLASLAEGAGEWRGSRNQRLIAKPATWLSAG